MITTLRKKQEEFNRECKLINLKYEYEGYDGEEQWAIVSELTEAQLFELYPDIINAYVPFVLLSVKQGHIIDEFRRNNHKHEMRRKRTEDVFGCEDGITEIYHPELITYVDPLDSTELKNDRKRIEEINKVRATLAKLKPIQRDRLIKNKYLKMSSRKIAKEEGVNYSTVDKSIKAAIKNFTKFYENQ